MECPAIECNLLQQRSNYERYGTKCFFATLTYAETYDLIEEPTVHYQPSLCTDTAFVDPNWNEPDLEEQRKSYKHDLLMIHLNMNVQYSK